MENSNPKIDCFGIKRWFDKNGKCYSLIDEYGNRWYYNENEQYHRLNGPACLMSDGCSEIWYKDGQYHNLNGPALKLFYDRIERYYIEGIQYFDLSSYEEAAKEYRKNITRE